MLKLQKPGEVKKKKAMKAEGLTQEQIEHMMKYEHHYAGGVLSYEDHKGLVQNIDYLSERAGVPVQFITTSSKGIFSDKEKEFLKDWPSHRDNGISGAYYEGAETKALDSMFALCGVMLRNHIDAKVVFMHELIASLKSDSPVQSRFVCIPNFILPKKGGGDIATWEFAQIMGWLLSRHGAGKMTILYINSWKLLEDQYGKTLTRHIEDHYRDLQNG